MDEPTDRRSNRSRKPKTHFDDIVQSSGPSKPSNALYRRLLDYLKPQLWKDAGPHNWKQRQKRHLCVICSKKHKLKKSFVAQQKEAGIEVITADVKVVPQVWSGCGFCDVLLCKMSSCFEEWYNQKG